MVAAGPETPGASGGTGMSIEVLPLGFRCNIGCAYCYQQPARDADNAGSDVYDMDAMKAALKREGFKFTIFGGEPLLIPVEDLAELWRFGYEEFGPEARRMGRRSNGIQTNGVLLTDKHVQLMKRYDVGVGLSIDGPDELNDARWAGSEEATRDATAKSLAALDKLLVMLPTPPSLIVTLHRLNGDPERLPRLITWLEELASKGLRNVNVHLLERDTLEATRLQLCEEETTAALLELYALHQRSTLSIEPFADLLSLLRGDDRSTSCVWNGCDPYTTDAVRGVGGHGERLNCGRTYKDGVQTQKAASAGYERYVALYHTPQAFDGCAGCRFFFACKGNCPGTAIAGDWRGRTEHCSILMAVFAHIEAELVAGGETPFSLDARRPMVEQMMVAQWAAGERPSVRATIEAYGRGDTVAGGAGAPGHQDVPHGDRHQDHTDTGRGR